MKNIKLFAAGVAFAFGSALAPMANAGIIDFEDIHLAPKDFSLLSTYHGYTWNGGNGPYSWVVSPADGALFPGSEAHSGNNYAWSNGGTDLILTGATFKLDGFWARSGYADSQLMTVFGYLNGIEVKSQAFTLTGDYQHFVFNFGAVDSVSIISNSNTLLDDISVSAVPEPGIYAMLLAGLGVLCLIRRKRQS